MQTRKKRIDYTKYNDDSSSGEKKPTVKRRNTVTTKKNTTKICRSNTITNVGRGKKTKSKIIRSKSVVKKNPFDSPQKNWPRAKIKQLMTTDVSPIKQIEFSLKSDLIPGQLFNGFIWILSNSEQFHYDNSMKIVASFLHDLNSLKKIILLNSKKVSVDDYRTNWIDVTEVGIGSYGKVLKVTDTKTNNRKLAVKMIIDTKYKNNIDYANKLFEYFRERNSLIKARSSLYVMQFLFAFKELEMDTLFLVYEFCLCDLFSYLSEYLQIPNSMEDIEIQEEMLGITKFSFTFHDLVTELTNILNFDILKVMSIHIFECYIILDYLAQFNIIHNDIKPENVLISETGHLKIGDFGLVTNTEFITSENHIKLMTNSDIRNYKMCPDKAVGTREFYDLETLLHLGVSKYKPDNNSKLLNVNDLKPIQTFLSDTWAFNMVILYLMIIGDDIFEYKALSDAVKQRLGITENNFTLTVLKITNTKDLFNIYIKDGLTNLLLGLYDDLVPLVISGFDTRDKRYNGYKETKLVTMHHQKFQMEYVSIEKIEKLNFFTIQNINTNTVKTLTMPPEMFQLVKTSQNTAYKNFGEFLDKEKKDKKGKSKKEMHYFNIKPGTEIMLN